MNFLVCKAGVSPPYPQTGCYPAGFSGWLSWRQCRPGGALPALLPPRESAPGSLLCEPVHSSSESPDLSWIFPPCVGLPIEYITPGLQTQTTPGSLARGLFLSINIRPDGMGCLVPPGCPVGHSGIGGEPVGHGKRSPSCA